MNLGVVLAIFGTLLALGVAVPGLLLAWALLLPAAVARARSAAELRPGRCLLAGLALALSGAAIILPLLAAAGPLQALGWLALALLLAAASLGAAGLAALMGERLRGRASLSAADMVRGAVALELAAVVPVVGWFVVLPVVALIGLGAAGVALWRPIVRPHRPAEAARGAQPS